MLRGFAVCKVQAGKVIIGCQWYVSAIVKCDVMRIFLRAMPMQTSKQVLPCDSIMPVNITNLFIATLDYCEQLSIGELKAHADLQHLYGSQYSRMFCLQELPELLQVAFVGILAWASCSKMEPHALKDMPLGKSTRTHASCKNTCILTTPHYSIISDALFQSNAIF